MKQQKAPKKVERNGFHIIRAENLEDGMEITRMSLIGLMTAKK